MSKKLGAVHCRDVISHLTLDDGVRVLRNAAASDIKFFASTTYDQIDSNVDIRCGGFRWINLQKPPYDLPPPLEEIDNFLPPWAPQSLAIWSIDQLKQRFA